MKKLLMLAVPFVLLSGVSSAAISQSCLSNPNTGSSRTGTANWTLGELAALGTTGCEVGDKIFANFGGSLSNTADTIQFAGPTAPVGPGNAFYTLNVNAGVNSVLQGGFTFNYSIAVDQTQVATGYTGAITRVTGGIQDNGTDGGTLGKTITGGASCSVNVVDSFGNVSPTACNGINATSLNVSETFAYTANNSNTGGARSISGIGNTFTETFTSTTTTGTPEPVSLLLMGTGLIGLSLMGRKYLPRR
jgi:hypothetical protein